MKKWSDVKQREIAKREKALKRHQARLKKATDRISNADKLSSRALNRMIHEVAACGIYYTELIDLGAKSEEDIATDLFGEALEE